MEYTQSGTGPAILMLPGLGCDDRLWQGVVERLGDHFTLVQPHTWGRGPLTERARELETLAGELGGRPLGIAGLSLGGYLAFECLRRWPQGIRAAALLDTTAYADDAERVETRHQVLRLLEAGKYAEVLGAFVPSVLAPGLAEEHPARELLLDMAVGLGAETFAADLHAILGRGDFADVLPNLRVPTLFVVGSQDTLTPPTVARQMAAEVPGSRLAEIPDAGHMTPLENPEATARVLDQFFTVAFHL
ncbi:MAG TPA: alpha/beta fold hydrolase [Deferrisomatales bacterium]|nr:alpha/beta fold hydrolase [Deferrisomatales bacterium]